MSHKWRWLLAVVVVLLVAVPATVIKADWGSCRNGRWCVIDPATGQVICEISARCESQGGEEEGGAECTPGTQIHVVDCEAGTGTVYECSADGCGWEEVWSGDRECQGEEGYDICWWNEETGEEECTHVPGNSTPCEDLNWSAAGIQCMNEYGLSVAVTIPCQRVGRIPYPRGMVIVPNSLWVTADSPAWNEAWSDTLDYDECEALGISEGERAVRNFRIGLAWERSSAPPYWEIENSGSYQGWEVSGVVWEQASWGKPRCGPGLTPGELLPSYRADVYTYWSAYWNLEYQVQRQEGTCGWDGEAHDDGVCECMPEGQEGSCSDDANGDGISDWAGWIHVEELCDDDENGDGIPDDHCWETVNEGWSLLDLRQFGYPTTHFVSRAAGPQPTDLEPNPGCNGVCIPVIEVQGLLRNPRQR